MIFKIRTNFPQFYQVIPKLGMLAQKGSVSIYIDMLIAKCSKYSNTQQNLLDRLNDRFQIQSLVALDQDVSPASFKQVWENARNDSPLNQIVYKLNINKPIKSQESNQEYSFIEKY